MTKTPQISPKQCSRPVHTLYGALRAAAFVEAARVPAALEPQSFGAGWTIERRPLPATACSDWCAYTLLRKLTWGSLHMEPGEIVMEDSAFELRRHLPIWMAARGRVLVTGLGLGCVLRGLIANAHVEHIDVIEIDRDVIDVVGAEFTDPRVAIHHGDALEIEIPGTWDYAWHDLHSLDPQVHLQRMHMDLFIRFAKRARRQGAWAFPRRIARAMPWRPLGSPRVKRRDP